jgi:hypothetical protein
MANQSNQLDGGQYLQYINLKDVFTGQLFSKIITAVNQLAQNVGASAVGKLAPPPPVDAINVSGTTMNNGSMIQCPSEFLHWTLTHNGAVQKGIQYLTEIATEPNFLQPHIYDHGCSRSGFLNLPTLDSNGNTQTYYMRSYPQYHGSDPAKPTVLGNLGNPVGIQMTGASQTSLLTSTGSGTAQSTGEQGGHGLGINLQRTTPAPKSSIGVKR